MHLKGQGLCVAGLVLLSSLVAFSSALSASSASSPPSASASFTSSDSMTSLKTILVTGGNKGIGKAICERLLKEWNDTKVIMACRSKERGVSARSDILAATGCSEDRLEVIEMDVSSDESVKKASTELGADVKLYGILNNAGVSSSAVLLGCFVTLDTVARGWFHSNLLFAVTTFSFKQPQY